MKKLFSSLILIALLVYCSASYASVGIRLNGTPSGAATDLNIECGQPGANTSITVDGSIYNLTCSPNVVQAGLGVSGYVSMASTATAISPLYSYIRKVLDSNGDALYTAGTLINGVPGQILTIAAVGMTPSGATTGGNFTLTPTTTTGFVSVKLSAIGDIVTLEYLNDTVGWVIEGITNGGSSTVTVTYKT